MPRPVDNSAAGPALERRAPRPLAALVALGLSALVVAPLSAQQSTRSPHGDLRIGCAVCHAAAGWKPLQIAQAFDHSEFGFPLEAAHGTASCRSCHRSLELKRVRATCVSCHADRHRGELGANCGRCHTARSFLDRDQVAKAHRLTRFPLEGGHLGVDCASCHTPGAQGSLQFVSTPLQCISCHRSDYDAAPNHVTNRFPTDCAQCHSQVAWTRITGLAGGHPSSPIALTGVHGNSACTDCHLAGTPYSAVAQTCDGCHHGDFANARDPDHVAAAFSTACTDCHGLVAGWAGATYVHATAPIDPKQGAHGAVTCAQCHTAAPYASAPTTCDGCHHPEYVATTNPNHAAAGYSTDCSLCHEIVANWAGAAINHPTSPIALTGVHGNRPCTDCHRAGQNYTAVPQTCDGCHHPDFVRARDPDHVAAAFPILCANCHGLVAGWAGATYAHATSPIDPKQGAHGAVTCAQCHTVAPYSSVPTTCNGCHHAEYVATTNPNHAAAGYSTDCAFCHQVVANWAGAAVNHPTSPIALTGVHANRSCTDCHLAGQPYSAVQRTCDGCHHTDFTATRDPDHVAAGFSTTCTTCHGLVAGWAGATYVHATTPIDPKQGAHGAVTCTQCHTTAPYSSVPRTCDGCHHADYVATTNPSHSAAGYSTDCAFCHQVVANWAGAAVNHPTSPIALTGVHGSSQCTDCHLAGQSYAAVQRTCDGCHHTDFVATRDPDHVAAAFSTICTNCHGLVAGWAGATYVHATTPIDPKQGAHGAVTCAQCHTTAPYSSVPRTCDGCHRADYVATTNPSHTAAGYSTDCASCHQVVAGWTGATVNHPTTPIALTGVHGNSQCTDCHLAGQPYSAVQRTCDGCHHTDFTATRDPDHVAARFSTTCTNCHGLVAGWAGATYAHATTPIDPKQGAHGAVTCAQCHTVAPYSSVPTTCNGCHHAEYVATTNPNHAAAGIPTTCADCHQIVAGWVGARYPIHPTTPLALSGPHAMPPLVCTDCHAAPTYASVPTTCDGCHHATYVAVTDPNHRAVGMQEFAATNCANCHSPTRSNWSGPTWRHMTIINPRSLRLPHEGATCADCHQVANDYTIKSCAGSGCHRNVNGPT